MAPQTLFNPSTNSTMMQKAVGLTIGSMILTIRSAEGASTKPSKHLCFNGTHYHTGRSTQTRDDRRDYLKDCLEHNRPLSEADMQYLTVSDYDWILGYQQRKPNLVYMRLKSNDRKYNERVKAIEACIDKSEEIFQREEEIMVTKVYENLKQEFDQEQQKNRAFCDEMIAVLERQDCQNEDNVQALEKKRDEMTLKFTDEKCLQLVMEQDRECGTQPGPNNPKKPYYWRAKRRQLDVLNKLVADGFNLGLDFYEYGYKAYYEKREAFYMNHRYLLPLRQKIYNLRRQFREEELKRQKNASGLLRLKLRKTGLPEYQSNWELEV